MGEVEDDFAWIRPVDNFLECRFLWRSRLRNRLWRVDLNIRGVRLGVIDETHYVVRSSKCDDGFNVLYGQAISQALMCQLYVGAKKK